MYFFGGLIRIATSSACDSNKCQKHMYVYMIFRSSIFLDYSLSLLGGAITFVHFRSRAPSGQPPGGTQAVMIIGNNNVFEVGSCILFLLKDCILWKIDLKPETLSVMTSYLTSVQCHDTVVHVMSWHCILFYTTFWAF